ncbi:MAG: hypothetical protein AABY22_11375 [Nanoarchaeota archaeon]
MKKKSDLSIYPKNKAIRQVIWDELLPLAKDIIEKHGCKLDENRSFTAGDWSTDLLGRGWKLELCFDKMDNAGG